MSLSRDGSRKREERSSLSSSKRKGTTGSRMKQGNSEKRYIANFESFEKSLNGEASSQVHAIRRAAIARFAELGFPTTRDEEWKYTDVSKMVNLPFGIS